MTDKIPGEGSIWKIRGLEDVGELEFAARTDAIKVTKLPDGIWRVYFEPKGTPTLKQLASLVNVDATQVECVVGADHVALVTPTQGRA